MANAKEESVSTCGDCGFEAAGSEAWETVEHPSLGTITRCPECESTDVHVR